MAKHVKLKNPMVGGVNVDSDLPIVKWMDGLKRQHGDIPKNVTPSQYIQRNQKRYDENKGKGDAYNYKGAIESGVRPEIDPKSKELHWGSINPNTGKDLKGEKHKTKHLSDAVELERSKKGTSGSMVKNPMK